jgi:hypothetical protein
MLFFQPCADGQEAIETPLAARPLSSCVHYPRQGSNIPNDTGEKPHVEVNAVQNPVQFAPKSASVNPFIETMVDASNRLTSDQKMAVMSLARTFLDRTTGPTE